MRILFVTPFLPFPTDSGVRRRMAITLDVLWGLGDVTLFSVGRDDALLDHPFYARFAEVHTVRRTEEPSHGLLQQTAIRVRNLADRRTRYTRSLDSPIWHDTFRALQPESFDLVWVQTL